MPRRRPSTAEAAPAPLVGGFSFAAAASGMRFTGRDDLALLVCDRPAAWSGLFTASATAGAPVLRNRRLLAAGGPARAVLVNAGIANAGTGRAGLRDAAASARMVARRLGVRPQEVLTASTGWIGERMDLSRIEDSLPALHRRLAADGLPAAARAIMTSDSVPKQAAAKAEIAGRRVTVAGIAKGSGMVSPNLATMLAFLVTDAAVTPALLRRLWRQVVAESFDALEIDGDMSTSDMVLLLASGAAGGEAVGARHPEAGALRDLVAEVALALTRQLAADGEESTRLVLVTVHGARSRGEARRAARGIARYGLVRAALAGASPAWGRVVAALGAVDVPVTLERFGMRIGDAELLRDGRHLGAAAEAAARAALAAPEVRLDVDLGRGRHSFTVHTCDLTPAYTAANVDPSLPPPPG